MYGSLNGQEVNAGFVAMTDEPGGCEKLASEQMTFIRDRIREGTFTDMILTNQRVVRGDLQRSTEHDTLVRIVDIEPHSRAMSATFRGQPTADFVTGKRAAIAFYTIMSLRFEIVEQELMAYEMPVTRIVEENSLKDMMEIKDRTFIVNCETACEAMQEEGNGSVVGFNTTNVNNGTCLEISKVKGTLALQQTTDDFVVHALQKRDMIKIKKLLKRVVNNSSGEAVRRGRLRPAVVLATESDIDELESWTQEDLGAALASEVAVNGWSASKAVALRIIKTIKNDILREGNLYVFTEEQFLGRNYTLNDVKFYIDKIANRIYWQAWMDVGLGLINIAGIIKLELYAGSVTPTDTDTGYTVAVPAIERDLGAQNNKVDEGLVYPHVSVA